MEEDARVRIVKEMLFDYVKSPSLKHIKDPYSVIRLAQEIVKRVDQGNSIWRKWDAQRDVLIIVCPVLLGAGSRSARFLE